MRHDETTAGARSRDVEQLTVRAAGRDWRMERTGDLESLWNEMDESSFGEDERLPYWAEIWPASLALCNWFMEQREHLQGKTCLDLGCGLGLTALCAASYGARVVGMDYEARALHFAARNTALNKAQLQDDATNMEPLWAVMDWRKPALCPGVFQRIWGGDILYESRFFTPLAEVFATALAPGGEIWIGEPERTVSAPAWERLRDLGWRCSIVKRGKAAFGGQNQTIRLWRITRQGD